ncbi:hypothetical protein A2U01_0066278 [Trifolium medium]|uniref:Uncharacterized protein n=1 Tax=Trifolium medium TaxID=97028 RepID=A0A392S8M8_9FABA|nr:hypothetical protein [Trifolium medium]
MFCKLRVAQGFMARCARHLEAKGFPSGTCALRSMEWRGAPLNQKYQDESLGVARRAGWFGAAR